MTALRASAIALALLLLGACAQRPVSPTNYSAIETRPLDAPADAAYNAAIETLFDQGYMIKLADGDARLVVGGLNTGGQELEIYARGMGGPQCVGCYAESQPFHQCLVWVRQTGPGSSELRVRFSSYYGVTSKPEQVKRFWEAVQTQLLASSAAPPGASR